MHGDKFGSIGKCRLDLDLGNHLRDAVHYLRASKERRAMAHEIGDRAPVARAFHDRGGKKRNGFRIVEAQSAREPPFRDEPRGEDQQLVLFSGREFHGIRFRKDRRFQVFQMRGGTAARPTSAARSALHCKAKYVRAAIVESPR